MALNTVDVVRAAAPDHAAILRLVQASGLPLDGLPEHLGTAVVARIGSRIVGTAALEIYDDGALLRSVAVAGDLQRSGIGHQVTDAAIELARTLGAPAVYLLTNTAERFFPKFGFERIERSAVPDSVRQSIEFTTVCCSSAVVMRKNL